MSIEGFEERLSVIHLLHLLCREKGRETFRSDYPDADRGLAAYLIVICTHMWLLLCGTHIHYVRMYMELPPRHLVIPN
jgi:hypothetical protein